MKKLPLNRERGKKKKEKERSLDIHTDLCPSLFLGNDPNSRTNHCSFISGRFRIASVSLAFIPTGAPAPPLSASLPVPLLLFCQER